MAFDPTKPVAGAEIDAVELRNQFNGLAAQIAALQAQVTALQTQLAQAARNPGVGEFDPGFADPPTTADLENIRVAINQIIFGMNW